MFCHIVALYVRLKLIQCSETSTFTAQLDQVWLLETRSINYSPLTQIFCSVGDRFSIGQPVFVRRRRGRRLETEENSLMWNLNAQLVKDDHMTVFQMLIHGVISNWSACRMEPGLWLVDSVRGYCIHAHSVVISVLADLLMLTCSACLPGSLTSPLFGSFGIYLFLSRFSCYIWWAVAFCDNF